MYYNMLLKDILKLQKKDNLLTLEPSALHVAIS